MSNPEDNIQDEHQPTEAEWDAHEAERAMDPRELPFYTDNGFACTPILIIQREATWGQIMACLPGLYAHLDALQAKATVPGNQPPGVPVPKGPDTTKLKALLDSPVTEEAGREYVALAAKMAPDLLDEIDALRARVAELERSERGAVLIAERAIQKFNESDNGLTEKALLHKADECKALQARVKELESERALLAGSYTTLDNMKTQLATMTAERDALQARVDELEFHAQEDKEHIEHFLKPRIGELEARVATLITEQDVLQARATTLTRDAMRAEERRWTDDHK